MNNFEKITEETLPKVTGKFSGDSVIYAKLIKEELLWPCSKYKKYFHHDCMGFIQDDPETVCNKYD